MLIPILFCSVVFLSIVVGFLYKKILFLETTLIDVTRTASDISLLTIDISKEMGKLNSKLNLNDQDLTKLFKDYLAFKTSVSEFAVEVANGIKLDTKVSKVYKDSSFDVTPKKNIKIKPN